MEDRSFFGLSASTKGVIFKHKGIPKLYDWQVECLNKCRANSRQNVIYSVPTSGGKTLVAEILMLEEICSKKRNAVFIVPFVSIVQEKVSSLSSLALDLGFRVEEYAGSKGSYPPTKHRKKNCLYVCTIEKASGLINSLIEEKRSNEIGLVVVDEMHLIGEPKRGALLENICIKLKQFSVRIVGMSATIGNIQDLTQFLRAQLFTRNFRPGSLREFVKIDNELFEISLDTGEILIRFYEKLPAEIHSKIGRIDPDGIGVLVRQVFPEQSCLVFCQSKKNCENVAKLIVETIILRGDGDHIIKHKRREKEALINAIKMENNDFICPIFALTLPYGVVYHHSGITFSERKLIEEAYSVGTISCICCTSTLAAGVNLPAQRVILRAPYVGSQFINKTTYKQMIGRAGRAGLSEKGESYLICKPHEANQVREMIGNPLDRCSSQLVDEELNTFILSCSFLNLVTSRESLDRLMESSFLSLCVEREEVNRITSESVDNLTRLGVLEDSGTLTLTSFGQAIAKANLTCEAAKHLYDELKDAQKKLVLVGDLHLLYLVTPHSTTDNLKPVYEVISSLYASLKSKELYVASCLGISEVTVARIMMGRAPPKTIPARVLEKFYLCLILYQLWNGKDPLSVAQAFKVDRGSIFNLLQQTASYASSVVRFCEAIDIFWPFVKLLSIFPDRLSYCCSEDLLPLMELPAVKMGRAKQLYKAGFKTVLSIAQTPPSTLTSTILHLPLKQAVQIVDVAKLKVLTKYETMQEEAEEYFLSSQLLMVSSQC